MGHSHSSLVTESSLDTTKFDCPLPNSNLISYVYPNFNTTYLLEAECDYVSRGGQLKWAHKRRDNSLWYTFSAPSTS